MRIGIVPNLDEKTGGVYQYCITMLDALFEIQKENGKDQYVIFTDNINKSILRKFHNCDWFIVPLSSVNNWQVTAIKIIKKIIGEDNIFKIWGIIRKNYVSYCNKYKKININQKMNLLFNNTGIELMIYPTSTKLSFEAMIPYIYIVHDLQHRIHPDFPEVSANGEFEDREYCFRNGIKNAIFILVDSKIGKEDVMRYYSDCVRSPDMIKVLPFLPASYLNREVSKKDCISVRSKYHLPDKYLFYPARFWPHKNHLRIIKALGLLKQKYSLNIPVVFCGSYNGSICERTFKQVMNMANELGIKQNVIYLGYVDDQDISALYKNAAALVMPTFFGPTNIPVAEAWELGCPVITSDIRGVRDQAGNAAIYVNPRSVASIADGIYKIWKDNKLRNKLNKLGRKKLALYSKQDYNKTLKSIIDQAKTKINKRKNNINSI